jgi:hypothetical protein
MQQHLQSIQNLRIKGERSSSLADHFEEVLPREFGKPKAEDLRNTTPMSISILWQGDPLVVNETFMTNKCRLCEKEKIEIVKSLRREPKKVINACLEIYGACRHKPKFHQFSKRPPDTEDSSRKKRAATRNNPTGRIPSICHPCGMSATPVADSQRRSTAKVAGIPEIGVNINRNQTRNPASTILQTNPPKNQQ